MCVHKRAYAPGYPQLTMDLDCSFKRTSILVALGIIDLLKAAHYSMKYSWSFWKVCCDRMDVLSAVHRGKKCLSTANSASVTKFA